jgi:hypothetical protein
MYVRVVNELITPPTLTGPAGLPVVVRWWRNYHESQPNTREQENPTSGTTEVIYLKENLEIDWQPSSCVSGDPRLPSLNPPPKIIESTFLTSVIGRSIQCQPRCRTEMTDRRRTLAQYANTRSRAPARTTEKISGHKPR